MNTTIEFTRNFMEELVCSNSEGVLGDLNSDDVLNVQDIIIMVNMILGIIENNDFADLNGDGIINVLDVIQLMNIILLK